MARLYMEGPYRLTNEKIDEVVTKISPGNYALGNISNDEFYVYYVGRSDYNLNDRLTTWVDENDKYKYFKFSYASSIKEAFEKECRNYHDFGESEELDNEKHPKCPDGENWKCPVCGE